MVNRQIPETLSVLHLPEIERCAFRTREALDDAELEVAVVVTVVRGEVEEQVVRAAFDVDVAHDVHVSPRVLTPERLTDPAWRMTGFIREIERDGISFQRHRAPVNIVH